MAIGPIDYQILMPKVNDAARVQSELQQRTVAEAQQRANNSEKAADHDTKTVHSQSEAQKLSITEDQTKKGRQQEQGKKQEEKKSDESEETKLLPQERTTIDIRI